MSEQFSTPTIQLNVKIGSDQGKVYTLKKKEISIGRGLENDIVIAHTEVSRCHTRISYQYGIFILEDLGSTNGTFVNDKLIALPYTLQPGQVFWIGSLVSLAFSIVREEEPQKLEPDPEPGAPSLETEATIVDPDSSFLPSTESATIIQEAPLESEKEGIVEDTGDEVVDPVEPPELHPTQLPQSYTLTVQDGPEPGQVFLLDKPSFSIGRHKENDIVIADEEVSRHQATISLQECGWVLEDAGSTNGTFVLEKQLEAPYLLLPGDTIWFGEQISLLFDAEGSNPWQS
jgi:pSer/pThr/pTyr-binding forkhead associated (FHA) protein